MTHEQKSLINNLRAAGYAVAVFSPDELAGVSRQEFEEHLIEKGEELLSRYQDEDE